MPHISFIGDIGHLGLGFGLVFVFQKQGNNQPLLGLESQHGGCCKCSSTSMGGEAADSVSN